MKKAFTVILALVLVLAGCANRDFADSPNTETLQNNSVPSFSTEVTEVTESLEENETEDKLLPTETESTVGNHQSEGTTETTEKPTTPSTTPTTPQTNEDKPKEDPPTETGTVPTTPSPTDPVKPEQSETVPTTPEATKPETETTEPATNPTVPPTEPTGCAHEWQCIHHSEEGHWRAGIVCDCGWTVYGDPSGLTSLWNAHSASFPPAESLFDHGGFGSMDEWIVDTPAYDEWICRHCGETKE